MGDLGQDVRYAFRTLRKSPGFVLVTVLTLALGIGAGTAMFSVLDGVLLRDLPVQEQEDVLVAWVEAPARDSDHLPILYSDLEAFREQTRVFRSVAGVSYYGAAETTLLDADRPVRVTGTWVTGGFFPLIGVTPAEGRTLLPSDDVPAAEPVMVISYSFWQGHFGGDSSAVGHALEWNGKRFTVVGVMPRGFEYPKRAEFWVPVLPEFPATLEAEADASQIMVFDMVGRLGPGASIHQAVAEFETFLRESDRLRPSPVRGAKPVLTPLAQLISGDVRTRLWTAAGAVGLLLLIACVNVANLLLIRGSARWQELATRRALGAGKRRLIRQLLTETGVLALAGGLLGALLAVWAVNVLVALAPPELPRREMVEADGTVLFFALFATAAAALLCGVLPALRSAGGDLAGSLRGGRRVGSATPRGQTLRHGLVVGQVALAILVVAGAGLVLRSFLALQNVEMGFEEEQLLVVETSLPPGTLPEGSRRLALQEEMLARLQAVPGVASVASLPARPFSEQGGWSAMYTGERQTPEEQANNSWVNFEVVSPGYFHTLDIPLRRGRAFDEQDREDAPAVAIISAAMADQAWPDEDPIGKRIKLGALDGPGEWRTVIGVVAETRYGQLTNPRPSLYLPTRQFGGPMPMSIALRTPLEPALVVPQIRRALQEVHPDWMLVSGRSIGEYLQGPLARPRFTTLLLGVLAGMTLLLAAVGMYGAMSATVGQRRREIGIRLALGASAREVGLGVVRQALGLVGLGILLGVGAAVAAMRLLRSLLFGVSPTDPLTLVAVSAMLLAVAVLASWLPARRAARVDPIRVLRAE